MIAITTKYLGATDRRGSRIVARAGKHRVVINCDDSLRSEDNHRKAARLLCDKVGWKGYLVEGGTETGYVYTFLPDVFEKLVRQGDEFITDYIGHAKSLLSRESEGWPGPYVLKATIDEAKVTLVELG